MCDAYCSYRNFGGTNIRDSVSSMDMKPQSFCELSWFGQVVKVSAKIFFLFVAKNRETNHKSSKVSQS